MEELVSVIMSTYNENKEQLKLSIESLLNQTYKNLEIIIVNDNPNNLDLHESLEWYSCLDKRIKIIKNNKNIGLVNSLNKAINKSTGYYIARMDADDISKESRIEEEIKYLKAKNLDVVSCHVIYIDENGDAIEKQDDTISISDIAPFLKYKNIVFHSTVLMKSEVIKKVGNYADIHSAEDLELWIRITNAGYKFGVLPDKLLYYRLRNNGISRKNLYTQYLTTIFICKECSQRKAKFNPDNLNAFLVKKKYLEERKINKYTHTLSNYNKLTNLIIKGNYIKFLFNILIYAIYDIRIVSMVWKTYKIRKMKYSQAGENT